MKGLFEFFVLSSKISLMSKVSFSILAKDEELTDLMEVSKIGVSATELPNEPVNALLE